jgi:D-sedoheptulose 7-phosphate isomerase
MIGHLERAQVDQAFARRAEATEALGRDARRIAAACHAMAERFHRGGRLISFGNGPAAADAAHLAVEFVHPVIVGKRALPAISLTNDAATLTAIAKTGGFDETFAAQLRLLAAPQDIAIGLSSDGRCRNVQRGLEAAHELGLLTVALAGGDGGDIGRSPAVDHLLIAQSDDPCVVKEIHVTIYHVLWELVHVFFEQPGLLAPGVVK